VVEAESSTCLSRQDQPKHTDAKETLMLWDSPDLLQRCRITGQSARPLRVLLAEDNPIDQVSIRRLLEKQGSEVFVAGNGRQAVDIFSDGEFDLVLLDVLMPEMDGFEVALFIRDLEKKTDSHVPIIVLTAYSLKAVYDKCRSVGMNGYLSKPVASSDLNLLVSVLLPDSAALLQK
jgi:CheY-like chemotaxis protein